jgi:hypothetical protein
MKWFLPFLIFIFSVELFTTIRNIGFYNKNNFLKLYDLVSIVEIIFYASIFYSLQSNTLYKKLIKSLSVVTVGYIIVPIIFDVSDYNYTYFGLIILDFSLVFFGLGYLFLKSFEETSESIIIDSGFWIALGVVLFSAGSCIVFIMHDSLTKRNIYILNMPFHLVIVRFLCVLLYLSISIAIILCKKKTRISSLPS